MRTIKLSDLKPCDKIVIPELDDELDVWADVLNVVEEGLLVEVYGNDRDDDNVHLIPYEELPVVFDTWH